MSGDGLVFVCICLAGILIVGVVWQLSGMWLDHRAEADRVRRQAVRARRFEALARREDLP